MDINEYLDSISSDRKHRFMSIMDTIKALYPGAEESMKYKMPTYTYKGGWVAIANQKNYISLYTCQSGHIEDFRKKHPEIKTGKGCINFRDEDEIPVDGIQLVIKNAIESPH